MKKIAYFVDQFQEKRYVVLVTLPLSRKINDKKE